MENTTKRAVKPYTHWTADTERAFLLALRLTGQAKKAAAEIGRSANGAYTRRARDPGFARAWDAAVAEQQAEWIAAHRERRGNGLDEAGGGRLTPWRERKGGWDKRKRGLFLRTLRRTKRVDQACAAAGMSKSAAHYLRGQSGRFSAAWEKALAGAALPSVAEVAYARAVEGWEEPIVQGGHVVGTRWRFSEGALRDLLRAELARETAKAKSEPTWRRPRSLDEMRDSILGKLEAFDAQRTEDAAAEQEAEWARAQRCWGEMGGF